MRKIIAAEFLSVDGFMSDPNDEMKWVIDDFNEEVGKYEDELYDNADTLFLGRITYKIFESYWPYPTKEEDMEMSKKINNINKIVFSKTLNRVEWENSTLVKDIGQEEIMRMKEQPGRNMIIVGSASIVQQFANLNLIDEYQLLVHPVVLGNGKPLFKNINDKRNLKLVNTRNYANGVILLEYST